MSTFELFEAVTAPRLDEIKSALAPCPCIFSRDPTPEDYLDTLWMELPAGLIALHRSYADYVEASLKSGREDELDFRDFVWVIAHRLFSPAT